MSPRDDDDHDEDASAADPDAAAPADGERDPDDGADSTDSDEGSDESGDRDGEWSPSAAEFDADGRDAHDEKYCHACGAAIDPDVKFCPECGADQNDVGSRRTSSGGRSGKDRVTAGILAILLGGLGAHHFYLENIGLGVLYLCFSWTFIPALVGLIEGILYLTKTDEEFQRQYVAED